MKNWEKQFDKMFFISIDYLSICSHKTEVSIMMEIEARKNRAKYKHECLKDFISKNFVHKQILKDEINEFSFCKKWELDDTKFYIDADYKDIIRLIDDL